MDSEDHNFIKSLEEQWTCPISKTQMHDPVITSDGHTYERQAIAHWLQTQNKSPITNLILENTTLIPNIAFKNLTQKLYSEMPVFLAKQQGLLTQIDQLKEEISYLREQLLHEKQKNQELNEKQERDFKTKKIEKQRHEHKNDQLKIIRDQKNKFQKQLQELRSKQQQQCRQIRLLKQELANLSDRFEKASTGERKYTDLYKKVDRNRLMILRKLEFSFISNFVFIGHLLQSIEDVKKYQTEQKQKGSQETIAIEANPQNQVEKFIPFNKNRGIIQHLETVIKEKINGAEKQLDELGPERVFLRNHNRLIFRRFPPISQRIRARNNARLQNIINFQNSVNQQIQNSQAQNAAIQPQQQENNLIQEQLLPQSQPSIPSNVQAGQDSQIYKQLISIKWMMSKRHYREIPQFYNYQVCRNHQDPNTYWYGVRISVLQSHIPFNEYLSYSWNHVRWLDLSSCNVDDALWQRFVSSVNNFGSLMYINANRNKIENIKKSDLEKFTNLVKFSIQRNKLSHQSLDEIRKYIEEHPLVKVEYNVDLMQEQDDRADFFSIQ